ELSGGQRQRVWLAMALAQETPILLLDEPTTFLDITHQFDVLDLCSDLHENHGRTLVAVLHDLNQACRYATHLVVMAAGRIVA
ncbi:ATP-binding cassette domain-containing protein, partial [Frankia tisae]